MTLRRPRRFHPSPPAPRPNTRPGGGLVADHISCGNLHNRGGSPPLGRVAGDPRTLNHIQPIPPTNVSESESTRPTATPHLDFPGRPGHALPFALARTNNQVRAVLASGQQLNLTSTIPRMVELALDSERPRVSMAATLRELGIALSPEEREAVLACATRELRRANEEGREYISLAEASRVLDLPLGLLRDYMRTVEGRRHLGYPIVIGDLVRIPAAALRPSERTAFLDSMDK